MSYFHGLDIVMINSISMYAKVCIMFKLAYLVFHFFYMNAFPVFWCVVVASLI